MHVVKPNKGTIMETIGRVEKQLFGPALFANLPPAVFDLEFWPKGLHVLHSPQPFSPKPPNPKP